MTTPTPFGSKTAIGCKFVGSKAAEIIELDNHALASAELVGGNIVMRNTAGDTICTVDMNKIVPVELTPNGLCMHFDFSITPANPMQPVDLVNGLPIYNDDYTAANYSEDGVELVNGAGANGFKIASLDVTSPFNYAQIPEYATLAEMLREGTGFTVECFSKQPIPIVLYGHNKGIEISGFHRQITLPYLNSDGVSTSGSSTVVKTYVDDAGNVYNIENAAGQEAMGLDKGCHMVFTADESGALKVYLNGFTGTGTVMCADFAGWDYDTILAPTYWMLCCDNKYDAQNPKTVKKLRMYNRALSIDEVRNNYRYELNYTPATSLAAATSNTLGGVKADPATEADTQPVRIGTNGKLYTAQGSGAGVWRKIAEVTLGEDMTADTWVSVDADSDGNAVDLSETVLIIVPAVDAAISSTLYYQAYKANNSGYNYVLSSSIQFVNNAKILVHCERIPFGGETESYIRTTFCAESQGNAVNSSQTAKYTDKPITGCNFRLPSGCKAGTKYTFWGVDRN